VTRIARSPLAAPLAATAATAQASRRGATAIWEGIRFTARTPPVRGAFLVDLSVTVLAVPVALFPVINSERFGGSPAVLGLFTTAMAVGGVACLAGLGLIAALTPQLRQFGTAGDSLPQAPNRH
jgi:hypothetical protein